MSPTLRAVTGAVDLRPVVGSRLTGFALRLEPSEGIHDPLMAKVLLLDDGTSKLAWVALDLIGLDPADDARLQQMIGQRLSMPVRKVLVSCTHTHSGPCSMPFRGSFGSIDVAWLGRTFDSIASLASDLVARLRPARMAHSIETVDGIGYNRQDGTSPIDERLLVVHFSDDAGRAIATVLNYATHPVVLGENNLLFSADFPGYATREVEAATGGIAMFVQGSAGDVNPFIFRDHPRDAGTFEVAEQMGRKLADATIRMIDQMRADAAEDVAIEAGERRVELPLDPPPSTGELAVMMAELLARRGPREMLPASPEARWADFELAWVEELEQSIQREALPRTMSVQLSAARVGPLLVVTFPLEIYSQIGLDVRSALAPRPVVVAGYTNGLIGYAPTDRALAQGGYGPAVSYRFFPRLLTPLARGTHEVLVRGVVDAVNSLTRSVTR